MVAVRSGHRPAPLIGLRAATDLPRCLLGPASGPPACLRGRPPGRQQAGSPQPSAACSTWPRLSGQDITHHHRHQVLAVVPTRHATVLAMVPTRHAAVLAVVPTRHAAVLAGFRTRHAAVLAVVWFNSSPWEASLAWLSHDKSSTYILTT